jgi:hypothetical protein
VLQHTLCLAWNLLPLSAHAASKGLQECVAFAATPDGQRAVSAMLQLHTAHYPEYIQELRGLADGAGVPFEQVSRIRHSKQKQRVRQVYLGLACVGPIHLHVHGHVNM